LSGKGNPYDNAKAESFLGTLKREEVRLKRYETFEFETAYTGELTPASVR
jgi:transposase InsO family protein